MLKQSTMFHSSEFQLTAARRRLVLTQNTANECEDVSTHSRPKAAGGTLFLNRASSTVSTHSRPKAAGDQFKAHQFPIDAFQLTAARRRLVAILCKHRYHQAVSTHSRPKAAGGAMGCKGVFVKIVSTHSRPKAAGGIRLVARL